MTSPVDFISGREHGVDAVALDGAEPVEGQHRLLDRDRARRRAGRCRRRSRAVRPPSRSSAIVSPTAMRAAALASCTAVALETNGTVRAGARVGLDHVEDVVLDRVLDVHQPADADARGELLGGGPDLQQVGRAQRDRRQRARRVAGVDTGLLDVLHDPAEVEVGAVVEGVDVDLDGVLQEAVDQHRVLGADVGGLGDVGLERGVVVDDLHAAAAEHVGGPDQHRVADRRGDLAGLGERRRHAVLRGEQAGVGEHAGERAAVLGVVDGLRRRAQDRHAGVLEPLRQAQRRLPAERADHPGDRAGRPLGLDHLEHVLERERLEVEAVGGVVVGGDGLGVAVDHHRLVAGVLQRHDRVHAGVVELDALPDPVRARSRGSAPPASPAAAPRSPRRRRSSGTACGRRTRPRRCPRSCRPAGCRAASAACGRRPHRPARAAGRRPAGRTGRAAWPGAAAPA